MKTKKLEKELKRTKISFFILFALFLFMCFFVIYISLFPELIPESMRIGAEEVNDCKNMSLEDTAYCLRDYVSTFYKYRELNDWINLNETELKEFGGDCRNWAFYYKKLANKIGYEAETFSFMVNEDFGHRFAIILSEEGYCTLDMTHVPDCFFFKQDDDRIWLE